MTNGRENDYLAGLVHELCKLPREIEWIEFKVSYSDPQGIPAILDRSGVERRGGCLTTRPSFTLNMRFLSIKLFNIRSLPDYSLLDGCLMASAVAPLVKLRA